jgi:hypothetical protein
MKLDQAIMGEGIVQRRLMFGQNAWDFDLPVLLMPCGLACHVTPSPRQPHLITDVFLLPFSFFFSSVRDFTSICLCT